MLTLLFCIQSETLQNIVSGCKHYLDHGTYNWRHDSVLLYLSKSLSFLTDWSIYADLPSFPSPSLIGGYTLRADLILHDRHCNKIHILELTLGFENNRMINIDRKSSKYKPPSYFIVTIILGG